MPTTVNQSGAKTRQELGDYLSSWASDPVWDLVDMDGNVGEEWEAFKDEIVAFEKQKRQEWDECYAQIQRDKAEQMGVEVDSPAFVYLSNLERRIEWLEQELPPSH